MVLKISNKIIEWYLQNQRNLPWRKTKNPYYVWLSEVILQQTRVAQGLPYYLKFIDAFPTIFDLAKANEQTVLKLWQGLGYYSRARNLHFSAKYIVNVLEGKFPSTYSEIIKLKGVGNYTASAIASVCFNKPTATVDGNVYRVLSRYFGIQTPINSTKGGKEFKKLAETLIDKKQPAIYNQAIMDFGALHCKPQNPLCKSCPINNGCIALSKNLIKELPIKEKKLSIKNRYFNYLIPITNDEKTILTERKGKGIWQGLYEFPLIETEKTIDEKFLFYSNEFQKLFPSKAKISLFNTQKIVHKLSHQHLHTRFWIVKIHQHEKATIFWNEINKYPVSVLISNFLKQIQFKEN